MALDADTGKRMLQLITSRYDDRRWRKKIEKTLSLPPAGVGDDTQRTLFLYLKHGLKAYKSRRADPDSWIVGGFATQEVVLRAKHDPAVVGPSITKRGATPESNRASMTNCGAATERRGCWPTCGSVER